MPGILTFQRLTVAIWIIGFNIQQFHVLSAEYIYVFCVYLRKKGDFCRLQHYLIVKFEVFHPEVLSYT